MINSIIETRSSRKTSNYLIAKNREKKAERKLNSLLAYLLYQNFWQREDMKISKCASSKIMTRNNRHFDNHDSLRRMDRKKKCLKRNIWFSRLISGFQKSFFLRNNIFVSLWKQNLVFENIVKLTNFKSYFRYLSRSCLVSI